ncbi:MerR family transcriptional regulator [Desulfuromonas sp. CSMB_57]|uniref:MerR family transcriptional regulator n=1 Tax=Desulfuromonas sp. CSMB_57 TaxID=2807629 RepID=UPI001CD4608C|nr:MerR family transcriptional regulator [Desulfuromonas sp. CSMB_57]
MALVKTWLSPEEAADKFGISKALLLEWVRQGLVRSEREDGHVARVNIDDVKLEVDAMVHRG